MHVYPFKHRNPEQKSQIVYGEGIKIRKLYWKKEYQL